MESYYKRYGTEYSGFFYPSDLVHLDSESIVYCIGAGEDIIHDLEVLEKLNSNVYIADPTPRAIQHIKMIKEYYETKIIPEFKNEPSYRQVGGGIGWENFWNKIKNIKVDPNKINFIDKAISDKSCTQNFYFPDREEYVSHSLDADMRDTGNDFISVEVITLNEMMNIYGHKNIDLLKLDVEGVERKIIDDIFSKGIFPKYLAIDFDRSRKDAKLGNYKTINEFLIKLSDNGYQCLHIDQNSFDASFIRTGITG